MALPDNFKDIWLESAVVKLLGEVEWSGVVIYPTGSYDANSALLNHVTREFSQRMPTVELNVSSPLPQNIIGRWRNLPKSMDLISSLHIVPLNERKTKIWRRIY